MDLKTTWTTSDKTKRQAKIRDLVTASAPDWLKKHNYIGLVEAGNHGIYASLGTNYTYAIFGRDSIEVAEDLLDTHPQLVRTIIFTLAGLQGTKFNPITEEEPGKIHHEYRAEVINNEPIPQESVAIMRELQRSWGIEGSHDFVYYGSIDATPLYIRLINRFVNHYNPSILSEKYIDREGEKRTIAESVRAAIQWLTSKIENSEWRLLEYRRLNPNGIPNQSWKDSSTSYLHEDGSLANSDGGVAAVEIQGYAYDALMGAAQLLAQDHVENERWLSLAKKVQQNTIEKLWMPDKKFFAQGLDRDKDGQTRQIRTLTSSPGVLLESRLLLDLPETKRKTYIDGIVATVCGPEFMTAAGIRCRSLRHAHLLPYADYHGTYAVWPKETYDIAKGLRQCGFDHLAQDLERRILKSAERSGEFYEFYYVETDGRAWYFSNEALQHFGKKTPHVDLVVPEPGQAWAISAVLSIVGQHYNQRPLKPMNRLEKHLLDMIFSPH